MANRMCVCFAFLLLLPGFTIAQPTIEEIDELIEYGAYTETESNIRTLKKIDSLSHEIGYLNGIIFANTTLPKYAGHIDNEIEKNCLETLDSLYLLNADSFSEIQVIELYLLRGYVAGNKGDALGELEWYIRADSIEQRIDDPGIRGTINYNFGMYYWDHQEPRKAVRYSLASAEDMLLIGDTHSYSTGMINTAWIYINLKEIDSALYCNEKAFNAGNGTFSEVGMAQYYQIVGEGHYLNEDYVKAEKSLDSVNFYLSDSLFDYSGYRAHYYYLLGQIKTKTNHFDEAIQFFSRSWEIGDSLGNILSLQFAPQNEILKANMLKYGRQDLVDLLGDYNELRDSIYQRKSLKLEKQLAAQFETSKKELQIERLKYNSQVNKTMTIILVFSAIILLLIALLIIYRVTVKRRVLREKLTRAEQEKQEISDQLNLTVDTIKEKVATINVLKADLDQGKVASESTEKIMSILDNNYLEGRHWTELIYHFDRLHNGFSQKIKLQYPAISNIDLQLLILIKLGYSNKEVAAIRNISEVGVKKGKQRLLKKMNLNSFDLILLG